MFRYGLVLFGWCVLCSFALIGFCTTATTAGAYMCSRSAGPCGKIHDCRQPNSDVFLAAYGLMKNGCYAPTVIVYQYPKEAVTIFSVETDSDAIHCLFREVPVTVTTIDGKAPVPTPSSMRLVNN